MSTVWSLGIFKEKDPFEILQGAKPGNLIFSLLGKGLRTHYHHIHTYADPFLFQNNENLYLFAEMQAINEPGYINCWHYIQDANWQDIGPVLREENCHYSYPFIIKDTDGRIYMIPESSQAKEISIWEFSNFPLVLRKIKTILTGVFFDSNIICHRGIYYLFTTNDQFELLIFFSDKLLADTWTPHPLNPITNNRLFSRNGGGAVMYDGKLIRIAQNCTTGYGEGIVVLKIERLEKDNYEESVVIADYRPAHNFSWQRVSRHHLSFCKFNGNTIITMDGLSRNFLINKFINGVYWVLKK